MCAGAISQRVYQGFTLTNDEILAALEEPLDAMMRSIKLALEQSPPNSRQTSQDPVSC